MRPPEHTHESERRASPGHWFTALSLTRCGYGPAWQPLNIRVFQSVRQGWRSAAELLRQGRRREAVFRQDALAIGRKDQHREPIGIQWRIGDYSQAVVGADRKL